MSVSRFTKTYFIFCFFFEFVLIYAVDKLFFIYRGLDIAQIAVMLTLMSILMIVFEIPSGAVADRWDRKMILIFSGISRAVCMIIWIFSTNLPMFIVGFAFLVAGYSFESGTIQAYVYDFLKQHGKEDDFEKIWGRGTAFRLVGIAIALALGGFLSDISYELTVGLSAVGPVIGVIIVTLLPRIPKTSGPEHRNYLHILAGGIKQALRTPVLLRVFLFTGIVLAGHGIMDDYIPVLLEERLELSNTVIGIWLAVGLGLGSIGSLLAHRLKSSRWPVLIGITVLLGALQGIVVFTTSFAILGVLVIFYFVSVLSWILIEGTIQRTIETDERATITSVNAFFQQSGAAIGGLIFGLIGNRYGIHIGYGLYGGLFLLYALGWILMTVRNHIRNRSL